MGRKLVPVFMEQIVGVLVRWGSSVLMQGPPSRFEILGPLFLAVLGFVMVLFVVLQGDPLTALGVVGLVLFAFGSFLLQTVAVRLAYQRILHGRG